MTSRDVSGVSRRGAFPSIKILETWRELLIFTITGELNNDNNNNKRKKKEEGRRKKKATIFVPYIRIDNDW